MVIFNKLPQANYMTKIFSLLVSAHGNSKNRFLGPVASLIYIVFSAQKISITQHCSVLLSNAQH